MGKSFHDRYSSVRELYDRASELLEFDLATACFSGPEETLMRSDIVQPAVTVVNIACLTAVRELGIGAEAAAGHSLGEYAALHAAGVIDFDATMRLVRERGRVMQVAADANPGGMLAVMGLDVDRLEPVCKEAAAVGSVEIANHNSPGQVILTGETAALETAAGLAKKAGAVYSVPLKVAGPWHSRFMREAGQQMAKLLADSRLGDLDIPVVANVSGDYYQGADSVRAGLARQVSSPVLWDASIRRLIGDGVGLFIELGPGTMLAGLVRDIDRSVRVTSVENPDSLSALEEMLSGTAGT